MVICIRRQRVLEALAEARDARRRHGLWAGMREVEAKRGSEASGPCSTSEASAREAREASRCAASNEAVRWLSQTLEAFSPAVEPVSGDVLLVRLGAAPLPTQVYRIAQRLRFFLTHWLSGACAVGIGPNRFVAMMAAESVDDGIAQLDEPGYRAAFWPRSVRTLKGVGTSVVVRLLTQGVFTVGQLAQLERTRLREAFGIVGLRLHDLAWGRDDTPVIACAHVTPQRPPLSLPLPVAPAGTVEAGMPAAATG